MSEEAKAIQEVAKASGKAIDATQGMARFIGRIIGGPLDQAVGIWEDRLKYTRKVNQLKLRDMYQQQLAKRGLIEPTRAVPMSFAIPLLQAATLEEDNYLLEMWSVMLVNAGDESVDVQIRRAFVSILEDMTSLDVEILKRLGEAQPIDGGTNVPWFGIYIGYLPEKAEPIKDYESGKPYPSRDVFLSISNLMRLNLIRNPDDIDGVSHRMEVILTHLGEEFLRICTQDTTR